MLKKLLKILKTKEFLVFFIAFIIIAIFIKIDYNDPMKSRIMSIRSLVEYHTLDISKITDIDTIDKICRDDRCYSTKPPLLTIIGASLYYIAFNFFDLKFNDFFYYLLILVISGFSYSVLLALFYKTLVFFDIKDKFKFIYTFTLGISSLLFLYAIIFSNHIVSATLVFIGFYFLLKNNFEYFKKSNIFYAGFFIALAFTAEALQGAIFLSTFLIYFIINKETRKYFYYFIIGAFLPTIFYIIYNLQVTGNIFPVYLNKAMYLYPGSYWAEPTGIDALHHNKLFYLFNILFGSHGILLYSPVLVFGFWGLAKVIKDKYIKLYQPAWLIILTFSLIILSLTTLTNNYGGLSYGFRWLVIMYPVIFLFIAILTEKFKNKIFISSYIVLFILSTMIVVIGYIQVKHFYIFHLAKLTIYCPLLSKLNNFIF